MTGQAWVAGHSVLEDRRAVRRAIGYMPDEFGVYEDLRVWEYLDFLPLVTISRKTSARCWWRIC